MNPLIYIADDEENIRNLIYHFLKEEDFEVETFATGDDLLLRFREKEPDLVILDVCMPGKDGYSITQAIRKLSNVPIILLTARDSDADFVTGFVSGCDDYFTKPFSPIKLVLRIKNIFSRSHTAESSLSFGDIKIFPKFRTITCKGEEMHATGNEFGILHELIKKSGFGVSRDELLSNVWGYENEVETRAVDDAIKRLRKKLTQVGSDVQIATVWGFGFKLTLTEEK